MKNRTLCYKVVKLILLLFGVQIQRLIKAAYLINRLGGKNKNWQLELSFTFYLAVLSDFSLHSLDLKKQLQASFRWYKMLRPMYIQI